MQQCFFTFSVFIFTSTKNIFVEWHIFVITKHTLGFTMRVLNAKILVIKNYAIHAISLKSNDIEKSSFTERTYVKFMKGNK